MSCGCAERREAIVKAVKAVGQFIIRKGTATMANYRVLKRIQHNGIWYDPGADFEMDQQYDEALIGAQAIEPVEPVEVLEEAAKPAA